MFIDFYAIHTAHQHSLGTTNCTANWVQESLFTALNHRNLQESHFTSLC